MKEQLRELLKGVAMGRPASAEALADVLDSKQVPATATVEVELPKKKASK
jgi:cobalamin biosynthesis protein CbiD